MTFPLHLNACDCHSHVLGPFEQFPLAAERTFNPAESPIERLEQVWQFLGIRRANLVQGSAHGSDHSAMLAAIARDPDRRRGIALLPADVSEQELTQLHLGGVRGVRFNWISHLLKKDARSGAQRLQDAGKLLAKVTPLGWHAEVHIDIADLDSLRALTVPAGMSVVVDHMAPATRRWRNCWSTWLETKAPSSAFFAAIRSGSTALPANSFDRR